MKNILLILFFLFIAMPITYSQDISNMEQQNEIGLLEIIYKFELPEKNASVKTTPHVDELVQNTDKIIEKLKLRLICGRTKSKYEALYAFDPKDMADRVVSAMVGGTYFIDFKTNTCLIEKKQLGEKILMIEESEISWTIQDSTMQVNGIPCQYATGIKKTPGFSEEKLFAWFTKTYPLPFGPSNVYGLPGIIVKAKTTNFTYEAINIRYIENQGEEIKFPKVNDKMVKSGEYFHELKKRMPTPPQQSGNN